MPRVFDPKSTSLWELERIVGTGGLLVLRLHGDVDGQAEASLENRLAEQVESCDATDVILDLSTVGQMSAAALRVLFRLSDHLAKSGNRLRVVSGETTTTRALSAARADDVMEVFGSLDAAFSSYALATGRAAPTTSGDHRLEVTRLRAEVHDLREKLATRPLIAQAMGLLEGRYGLSGTDVAHHVLRAVSQQHNMKMRDLAAAVVGAKAPATPLGPYWFPNRVRPPAPTMRSLPGTPHADRSLFLDNVLDAVRSRTAAVAADIHLVDLARGGVTRRRHRGLAPEVMHAFDALGAHDGLPHRAALLRNGPVTIPDVRDDHDLPDEARTALSEAGINAVHSMPVPAPNGSRVGAITVYHAEPGWRPTTDMDDLCTDSGAWLDWHARRTTLDALEDLHNLARSRHQTPVRPDEAPAGRRRPPAP